MSHLIFPIDCQPLVPERMAVTEVFIQGIYIPLISFPEFAVTNVKIPEFSYNPPPPIGWTSFKQSLI